MRRVALLAILCFGALSAAVEPEKILGQEDTVRAQEPTAPADATTAPTADIPEVSLKNAKETKAIYLSLRAGWHQRNYKLLSQGLNGNFPGASGYEIEVAVEKEISETGKLTGSFLYGNSTFSNIPSLTPSTFSVVSWRAFLQYGFLCSGQSSVPGTTWWTHVGYEVKKRGGVAATPITPMTDIMYQGPRIGVSYEGMNVWGAWGFNLSSYFMIPIFFRENLDTTGSYRFGFTSESALSLRYQLRDTFMISLGAGFAFDYRGYSGVGTRATSNATEIETVISIPLELQIRF